MATTRVFGDGEELTPISTYPLNIPKIKKYLSAGVAVFGMMYIDPTHGAFMYANSGFVANIPCPAAN